VADIEATAAWLRSRGVAFEEYDLPFLKTENGIAEVAGIKAAWFRDPDGYLLALMEGEQPGA
jgi:hypothetical protein